MSKGIVSNRGGQVVEVVAGGAAIIRDETTGQTGTTITFSTYPYTFGATGVQMFRNGVLMDKVSSFTIGGTDNAEEYQEVNSGETSSQILLNTTNPAVATERFEFVFAEGTITVDDSSGGTKNFYTDGDAENHADTSKFTTGNNPVFDNGGVANLNFSISTTPADQIDGTKVFKAVLHATPGASDDDYIAGEAFPIPQGYRGRVLGIKGLYKYNGADNDIKWVAEDDTNTDILTLGSELLTQFVGSDNISKTFTATFFCPSDCEEIKVGPQVVTHATGGEILIWDEIEVSPDPFIDKELVKINSGHIIQAQNAMTTRINNVRFNLATATIVSEGDELITLVDSTNTMFVANQDLIATFTINGDMEANAQRFTAYSPTYGSISFGVYSSGANYTEATVSIPMKAGENIQFNAANLSNLGSLCKVFWSATAKTNHIVSYSEHARNGQIRFHTANGVGSSSTKIKRLSNYELDDSGSFASAATVTATTSDGSISFTDSVTLGLVITINEDNIYHASATENLVSGSSVFGFSRNSTELTTHIHGITTVDRLASSVAENSDGWGLSWTGMLKKGDKFRLHYGGSTSIASANQHNFTITKIGASQLLGNPLPLTAYIKDVKASGVVGGSFNSGAWRTRDLNNLSGNTSFVSLAANQFTLGPGTYDIDASAPANQTNDHITKLYNITDSSDDLLGSSGYAEATAGIMNLSLIRGQITLTATKMFEIQHICQTTKTSNGLGIAAGAGISETYTIVKVTKVN